MNNKKILQINAAVNFSSTGKIVEQIGDFATKRGWTCYVAHGERYANPTRMTDLHIESKFGERSHAIFSMLFDAHGLGSYLNTRKLIWSLKKIHPDIIHLHNIHGYYISYSVLFEYVKEVQPQVIWTIHDNWPYTGHCVSYEPVGCEKWHTLCHDCPMISTYPKSLLLDRSKRNYQRKKELFTSVDRMTIVPVSDFLKNDLSKSFLNKYPLHRIYSGIDTNLFRPVDSALREELGLQGKFIILGVASGWRQEGRLKGFLNLRKRLDDSYWIVLVGLTPAQISSMPNGITGLPLVSNMEELARIYSMADIFINPTLQDTFGLTSVEAQACGTPSIVYKTGGAPETINETTGMVVKKNDFDALRDAVIAVKTKLSDSETAEFKSSACRQWAVSSFEQSDRFNEYVDLYESLI